MIDPFLAAKWAHVIGASVLLGAGAAIAWFQLFAYRTGDPATIAGVARLVVKADWTFTLTAGLVQPISGAALVWLGGWDPMAPWLIGAYALYLLIFLCWAPVVWLQLRLARIAMAAVAADEPLPPVYARTMRVWFALGWPAFIAMLALIWVMVAKPDLQGLLDRF